MNWNNVNLKDNYERNQNIVDSLSFETLLLEIDCNIKDVTKETIRAQFNTDISIAVNSAKEVFEANLESILKEALESKNIDSND
jgi:hypothetical protein